jgi:hypothetical protein
MVFACQCLVDAHRVLGKAITRPHEELTRETLRIRRSLVADYNASPELHSETRPKVGSNLEDCRSTLLSHMDDRILDDSNTMIPALSSRTATVTAMLQLHASSYCSAITQCIAGLCSAAYV